LAVLGKAKSVKLKRSENSTHKVGTEGRFLMVKSKSKSKAGVFNIFVDGRYIDKVCAVNESDAVDKYKRANRAETGKVTAKWHCVAPIQMDCDEYVKQLRQIEKEEENAGVRRAPERQ
jgi:Mg2+ and Co2+ transporter CorA